VLGRYISLISGMPAPAVLIVRGVLAWHENEAAERLFGTEGDRAGTLEAAKAVFADGEARVHPIAGRAFALAPLFDGVGEIEAVLLVESPLSCLPKVLNAFQEPMRHFSRIIHSLPHPVLAARPNGTIDFLSDSWYELVGEGRLMGDPAASFYRAVPPAERAMARARIASGAAGESPFSFRVPLITRTGQRWFDVTLRPIVRAGVAIKWVGAIADVDSEVRSRRSLARSQRHLRFVSEAAGVFARAEGIDDLAGSLARLGAAREEVWGFAVPGLPAPPPGCETLAPADALAIEWKVRATGEVVSTLADGRAVIALPVNVLATPGFLFVAAHASQDELSERTLETARDIAQRLRPTLERRVMLEREQRVSAMLQRAMLPLALPAVPGLRFDIAYTAASDESSVGGDWYDAFELGDGRIAIVIGDIAGHGLDAAIVMGSIRQVMRAVSLEDADPAVVLARVNRTLAHEHGALASAFYGVLDLMTLEFIYGNAGHPPPYIVAAGAAQALPMDGILLGSQDGAPAKTQRVALPPDGAIVLYTDGIIERTRDITRGEAALQAVLERWSAANFTSRSIDLQDELLAGGPRHDDAALFIVRLDDDDEALDIALPASLRNATRMRAAFERFVRRRGFSEERIFDITLGVAEAINNAAEHAYGGAPGTVRLSARRTDRWLEATISDAGRWSEKPSDPDRGRGISIIQRVFDDVEYAKTIDGTVVSLRARLPGDAQVAFAANG